MTHAVIGCAMRVHTTLGNGFQEVIYQRALAIELEKKMISFQREVEMKVFYDNIEIGSRRVDFYIDDEITVELKALVSIQEVHLAQAKTIWKHLK